MRGPCRVELQREGEMMVERRQQRAMGRAVAALVALVMSVVVAEAATVVDVYRMIQFDLRGAPLGSRRAPVNHFAASGVDVPGADLSRAVVVLPALKVNITQLNGTFPLNSGPVELGSAVALVSSAVRVCGFMLINPSPGWFRVCAE